MLNQQTLEQPKMLWKGTVYGQPVSKSNSQILWINWRPIYGMFKAITSAPDVKTMVSILKSRVRIVRVKSVAAMQYQKDFHLQTRVNRPPQPIACDVFIRCNIWYQSRRSDVDHSLVLDSLQEAGIIKNDRQVRVHYVVGRVDPANPRVEMELWECPLD